ncbi:MAG: YhcN/YlaJ family sporulation lipoprotein [Alicyclobacillaceae bacterium]|nr:YhcN/YlaJ family sporulation lipoprotein [Alicyclobacillaceae bacterium]
MRRQRTPLMGAAVVIALACGLVACAPTTRPPGAEPQAPDMRIDRSRVDVDGDGDRERWAKRQDVLNPPVSLGTLPSPRSGAGINGGSAALADRIADVALSVPGVQSAAAVVREQHAYIGVRVSPAVWDAGRGEQVKTEIRQRLLIQSPIFPKVHVTEDPALVRQIEDVADAVRAGRSLNDFKARVDQWERQIPVVAPKVEPPVPSPSRAPTETPPTPAPPYRGAR